MFMCVLFDSYNKLASVLYLSIVKNIMITIKNDNDDNDVCLC